MAALPFVITAAGRNAIVNAAHTGTGPVVISQIALGSTYLPATDIRTGLANEVARITAVGGSAVAPGTIHVTGADSSAASYSVREVGLFTDGGILFALYSTSTPLLTKGTGTTAFFAADLVITGAPAGSVTVGDTTFSYPPATETVKGVAEIATADETVAGTDDERIVTPKKLKGLTATETRRGLIEIATTAEAQAGTDAERALTPAALQSVTATNGRAGVIKTATAAEVAAKSAADKALTAANVGAIITEVFGALYPIGEILMTRREGNPATWLNFGTWQRHGSGKTLVSYSESEEEFNAIDKTGGQKTVTLTVGQLPAHKHSIDPPATSTASAGDHTHFVAAADTVHISTPAPTATTAVAHATNGNSLIEYELRGSALPASIGRSNSAGNHTHTFDIAAFDSAAAGSGEAHTNLQPYIVVHVWRRIS